MNDMKCTYCGSTGLEPGFVRDSGEGSRGYTQWVEGTLERGILGGARQLGRPHWLIQTFRCPRCKHLEMFATDPV